MIEQQSIRSYLEYLAEASRRILKSYHFEYIFKPKISRGRKKKCLPQGFYANRNNLISLLKDKNFIDCFELQTRQDRDTILCSGLLIVNVNNKLFCGPLVYTKLKKDYEVEEFYISEIHINYDILSTLIDIDEVDEEEAFSEYQKLSRIINDLENKLESFIGEDEDKDLEEGLEIMETVEQEVLEKIDELLDLNPSLKNVKVKIYDDLLDYNYQDEIEKYKKLKQQKTIFSERPSIFFEKGIIYIKSCHIAWLDNPIFSAYSSLKELLKLEKITNRKFLTFLEILLHEDKEEKKKYLKNEINFEEDLIRTLKLNLEKVFKIFPLPLSRNQRTAISNAFGSFISYIQGPPGTGKSHTITAIAILSLLTGRKVLVVSAKVPAIEVIKSKLEEIFNLEKEFGFLPYVFFHKNYKKAYANYINAILNRPSKEVEEEYKFLRKEKERLISEINKLLSEIERLERQKSKFHNILHQYKISSERVINIHNRYVARYNYDLKNFIKNSDKLKINEKILENLKNKLKLYTLLTETENKFMKIFRYKLIKTYKVYIPITKELIRKGETIAILNELTDFCYNFLKLKKLGERILQIHIEDINQRINDLTNELISNFKQLVKVIVKERINRACIEDRNSLINFKNLLKSRKHSRIKKYQDLEKINKFLNIFPLFISEIRDIGEILPLKEEIFDLVIVDESSQVNLSEIIPIFYRGKNLCVVGDDKQLSLEAVGLNFNLSKRLDTFMWEKYKPGNLSYDEAKERKLTVSTSSILDLLIENKLINKYVMLNEHFRSLPKLIKFNSKEFYENSLIIMTDTPDKKDVECFIEIKVKGKRDREKVIQEEVDKVVEVVEKLKNGELKINNPFLSSKEKLTIGIVSIISKGVLRIKEALEDKGLLGGDEETIKVGTPEDLQGHEFDVVIFPLFLDDSVRHVNHYENERRFNVATSRAKFLTIFIRNENLPRIIKRIARYINHFGGKIEYPQEKVSLCGVDPEKFESELERYVYTYLEKYVEAWQKRGVELIICNQYEFGPYRLDFVIFNKRNGKYVAIEVDGKHHFEGQDYAEWHKERIELLKRAGWKVINTPYYRWFYHGWLKEDNPVLGKEVKRIYDLCDIYLGLNKK